MKLVFAEFAPKFPQAATALAKQLPKGSSIRRRAIEIARQAELNAAVERRRAAYVVSFSPEGKTGPTVVG